MGDNVTEVCVQGSVVVKDLRLKDEDKDKESSFKDKDEDLKIGPRTRTFIEDKLVQGAKEKKTKRWLERSKTLTICHSLSLNFTPGFFHKSFPPQSFWFHLNCLRESWT